MQPLKVHGNGLDVVTPKGLSLPAGDETTDTPSAAILDAANLKVPNCAGCHCKLPCSCCCALMSDPFAYKCVHKVPAFKGI